MQESFYLCGEKTYRNVSHVTAAFSTIGPHIWHAQNIDSDILPTAVSGQA
jgi:hypothetical protein